MTTSSTAVGSAGSASGRVTGSVGKYPPLASDGGGGVPKSPLGVRASTSSGVPAVPTSIDDSERTQIADSLPDFTSESENEPTRVGGPALPMGPSRHSTPMPVTQEQKPKMSLDRSVASIDVSALSGGPNDAPAPAVARTTTPARDWLPDVPPKQMAATLVRDVARDTSVGGGSPRATVTVAPPRQQPAPTPAPIVAAPRPGEGRGVQEASAEASIVAGVVTGVAIAVVIGTPDDRNQVNKEIAANPSTGGQRKPAVALSARRTPPPHRWPGAAQPAGSAPGSLGRPRRRTTPSPRRR